MSILNFCKKLNKFDYHKYYYKMLHLRRKLLGIKINKNMAEYIDIIIKKTIEDFTITNTNLYTEIKVFHYRDNKNHPSELTYTYTDIIEKYNIQAGKIEYTDQHINLILAGKNRIKPQDIEELIKAKDNDIKNYRYYKIYEFIIDFFEYVTYYSIPCSILARIIYDFVIYNN